MTHPKPQALLLDMDDTILEDTVSTDICWQKACRQFANEIQPLSPEALQAQIDEVRAWYWGDRERHRQGRMNLTQARAEIVASAFQKLGLDQPDLAARLAVCHAELREQEMKPFAGALETLHSLREQGIRLGLVTNGAASMQRAKIERFGLASFFECIVIEGEFGVGKPDERVYQHALGALGLVPAQAWMVGDNLEWDVGAPQRLGIAGVWVDFAQKGLPASSSVHPDYTIHTLPDVRHLLA
jgi:putative hydrolase of the HAD superfamily